MLFKLTTSEVEVELLSYSNYSRSWPYVISISLCIRVCPWNHFNPLSYFVQTSCVSRHSRVLHPVDLQYRNMAAINMAVVPVSDVSMNQSPFISMPAYLHNKS
jgi:hypothetical protein